MELFAEIATELAIRWKIKMADIGTPCSFIYSNEKKRIKRKMGKLYRVCDTAINRGRGRLRRR
jgi:hypothetical protein